MSKPLIMNPVGYVRNECRDVTSAERLRNAESIIEVNEAYRDALYMIEAYDFLDVVFYFHMPDHAKEDASAGPESDAAGDCSQSLASRVSEAATPGAQHPWRRRTKSGEVRGVFASRSPVRPNRIGITTVRLTGRDGTRLRVTGLDAIDGTPVLDIKSCNTSNLDDAICGAFDPVHTSIMKSDPRIAIRKHIFSGDTEKLLMLAARFHGHYCPGLAMGVMAATFALKQLAEDGPNQDDSAQHAMTDSDGLEDLLAIVETNNCFADGVQLVTGCSFGNNSLIFHDLGKTAFTLTRRDGNGIRVISRHESPAYIREMFPDFDRHYQRVVKEQVRDEAEVAAFRKSGVERSFGTLQLDFDRMFETQRVAVTIPDYAPSHESGACSRCGESVMATRLVGGKDATGSNKPHEKLCLKCAGVPFSVLDGHGIQTSD